MIVLGRPEEATAILRELLPRFEELGDVQYHAMTTSSLGWAAYVQGDAMGAARWAIRGLIENIGCAMPLRPPSRCRRES